MENDGKNFVLDLTDCQCDSTCLQEQEFVKIYFTSVLKDHLKVNFYDLICSNYVTGYLCTIIISNAIIEIRTYPVTRRVQCQVAWCDMLYIKDLLKYIKELYVPQYIKPLKGKYNEDV